MKRTTKIVLLAAMVPGVAVAAAAAITWGPYLGHKDAPVPRLTHAGMFGDRDGPGRLSGPVGVAVSPAGEMFTDTGHQRVVVFDSDGRFLRAFGRDGSGPGELDRPMHLVLGPDGLLYVAEYLNDRIAPTARLIANRRFAGLVGRRSGQRRSTSVSAISQTAASAARFTLLSPRYAASA